MCLFELWFSQDICPVVGLLGHMVGLILVFKEIPILFCIWLCQLTFPPTVHEGSLFSISWPPFIVCTFFDDGHSDHVRWYLIVVFNLQRIRLQCRRSGFDLWVGKITWRRERLPTPVLLPGKSHGRRSLVGCSPWGREELGRTERLPFHFSLSLIGEGNGNPLQCSCLENPRDGGAWWAAVYGVTQSPTRLKRLRNKWHVSLI